MTDGITLTSSGTVVGGGNYLPDRPLTRAHWHELTVASGIDPDVIAERGYVSIDRPRSADTDGIPTLPGLAPYGDRREQLKRIGFPTWALREDSYFPMLWLPKYGPRGTKLPGQIKPWRPVPNREGKPMKYASARGATGLDVHPRWSRDPDPDGRKVDALPAIQDPDVPLWITEGVKKADSLTSRGICTVALDGVFNWRNSHATLGDWEDVRRRGREVYICFDADTITKPMVQQAMIRLGRWLRSQGVRKVWYLVVPASVNGTPVKGVDDFFAAGGTVTELERAATEKPPKPRSEEDRFTDSALAEQVVTEALADRFVNVVNMGWYAYDGRIWSPCPDATVLEAVREYARDMYRWALQEEQERVDAGKASDTYEADGWRKVQSASRLGAILRLAAGNVEIIRELDQFDTWPDLLNTPAGVLDLTTGTITPHDPALMFTKITAVDYVKDARSDAFAAALEAVPAEAREWLRVRLGQAITGYEPDDERLLLLTGGGENGKTTLMDCLYRSLGGGTKCGYAALVPNTLLLRERNRGAATPEKMTLQGVRLAYMEETPEGRHLDTNVLKEVIGTPTITGRKLFRDFVEFASSHSMFLNTNHVPRVDETDRGTWRRLLRLEFPFTYVKRPEDVTDPEIQRVGIAGLKAALAEPDALRAALAWLVSGARDWYASGRDLRSLAVPECVEAATRKWRTDSDLILLFMDETVRPAAGSWIATQDLYWSYRKWSISRGFHPMSISTFVAKVAEHPELPAGVTKRQIKVGTAGQARPGGAGGPWLVAGQDPPPDLPGRPWSFAGLRYATQAD